MQLSASVTWCSDCLSDLVQPPDSAMPSGHQLRPCPDRPEHPCRDVRRTRAQAVMAGGDRAVTRDHEPAVSGRGTDRRDHVAPSLRGRGIVERGACRHRWGAGTTPVACAAVRSALGCILAAELAPRPAASDSGRHGHGSGLGADPGGCSKPRLALSRSPGGISGVPRGLWGGPRLAGAQSSHADHPHTLVATGPP
jgi:hypothetical protein